MGAATNSKGNGRKGIETLGEYLKKLRLIRSMSLREVQELTNKEVSHAYLSELENRRFTKPSPNILQALSVVYEVPYEALMERAGYLPKARTSQSRTRRIKVGAVAIRNITPDEKEALIDYLAFLRCRRKKNQRRNAFPVGTVFEQ